MKKLGIPANDQYLITNEITDPETGHSRLVPDYHMMFIVTPKEATFPRLLGMKSA